MTDLTGVDDAAFLEETVRALEASVRYYSSKNKPERERWVVETFLENMNISFLPDDVRTSEVDPPDAIAIGARFEVKEILDPGRRRHDEYREELEKARAAKSVKELMTLFTPRDSSIGEIFAMCGTAVADLDTKYPPAVRSSLDLIFYVNLQHVFDVHQTPGLNTTSIAAAGWRSVSFVKGRIASCFFASPTAPQWLQERVGLVSRRQEQR